jgi:septal ring factor EnvC (AmiA/AmiB activator)
MCDGFLLLVESRKAWEKLEQEIRQESAEKDKMLAETSSKLESLQTELSALQATHSQLSEQGKDSQRLLLSKTEENAQLSSQVTSDSLLFQNVH